MDGDLGGLIYIQTNFPLDDSEVNFYLFAGIQNLIEALGVEEVTDQADSKALNSMFAHLAITLLCN